MNYSHLIYVAQMKYGIMRQNYREIEFMYYEMVIPVQLDLAIQTPKAEMTGDVVKYIGSGRVDSFKRLRLRYLAEQ